MKKYLSFALILVLTVFSFGRLALAEDGDGSAPGAMPTVSTGSTTTTLPLNIRQQLEAQREALQKELKGKAEALKSDIEAKREALKTELEAKKKEFQATIKADNADFKAKLQAEKADFQKNIKAERADFRGRAKEILSNRYEETVKTITDLQNRVADRITKIKALGKDTSKAEVYLADSKQKLADAETQLAALKALVPTTDDKVTVDNWQKIKTGANDVKNLIKESHQDLVDAIQALKGLGQGDNHEDNSGGTSATSTTPVSTSSTSSQ